MKRYLLSMFAGALAMLIAAPASAQTVLDQNKVGAALAILYVTGVSDDIATSALVTNTSATGVAVHGEVISGDPDDSWRGQSFSCYMTPFETTQFFFQSNGVNGSRLTTECSQPGTTTLPAPSSPHNQPYAGSKGILWLSLEASSGSNPRPPVFSNVLEGKSVVFNFTDGSAFEVGAVPFQSPDPATANTNSAWEFDGSELAQFPEALSASFHAPVTTTGLVGGAEKLSATLITFVLDGRLSSSATPNAEAVMYFYNDDEEFFNTSLFFDCFAMLKLEDIDSRFLRNNLGSPTGNLQIIPQSVDPADANHDGQFGINDDARTVGILGWLVQQKQEQIEIEDALGYFHPDGTDKIEGRTGGEASGWGSLLTTSITPLPNNTGDSPALTP
ncbi:MAG: hypothetical protein GY725_21570 [bacterium]|nr:hypothetical protein [bacterium]